MLKQGKSRHSQIADWIRSRVERGVFKVDEKLPSENKLTEQFGVSRVTVRRALQTLENEEMIYRCQGLGSFVSDARSHQPLVKLTDFSEDMTRAGLNASSMIIRHEQVPVPDRVHERLDVEAGSTVTRMDRLRLGDGEPVAFDITWLPLFYGQLLKDFDLKEDTIYRVLESEYDIPVIRGCYRIQAESADAYLAGHLKVEEGAALLLIDRQSFTVHDKPVYYQKRYYRSDKVLYELLLERGRENEGEKGELPLRDFSPVFTREA